MEKLSANSISSYDDFFDFINSSSNPLVYSKKHKIELGSAFQFPAFQDFDKVEFDTVNEMVNYYIEKTNIFRADKQLEEPSKAYC